MTVDPLNPATVYVTEYGQLLLSRDGGATWNRIGLPVEEGDRLEVAVDAVLPGRIYATGVRGLLISDDDGATWRLAGAKPTVERGVFAHPRRRSDVFGLQVSTDSDGNPSSSVIWRSSDGGRTWRTIEPGLLLSRLRPDPRSPEALYGLSENGVFHSMDGGETWRNLEAGISGQWGDLATDPQVPGLLVVGSSIGHDGKIVASDDGGETWAEPVVATASHVVLRGDRVAVLSGGRLFRIIGGPLDGASEEAMVRVVNPPTGGIVFNAAGHGVAGGLLTVEGRQRQGVFSSVDGGESWVWRGSMKRIGGGSYGMVFMDPFLPEVLFAHISTGLNFYARSEDAGLSWDGIDVAQSGIRSIGQMLVRPPIVAHPEEDGVYYLGDLQVYRSEDFGSTWSARGPLERSVRSGDRDTIGGLVLDPRAPTRILASLGDSLWFSQNEGATWEVLGRIQRRERIFSLAYHPIDANQLYSATVGGVYRSVDGGLMWERSLTPESKRWISAHIRQHPIQADRVYVVTSRELYESRDGGRTWQPLHQKFGGLPWFNDVAVSPTNPEVLFVATTWGLFKLESGSKTSLVEEAAYVAPESFGLDQNFPNPFNPSTTIRYQLSNGANVELGVYTMLGQKIRHLVETHQPTGHYTVRWDGRDDRGAELATGVYVYRLKVGTQTQARKLLLLR